MKSETEPHTQRVGRDQERGRPFQMGRWQVNKHRDLQSSLVMVVAKWADLHTLPPEP